MRWLGACALTTLAMFALRAQLGSAHIALGYLLVVLAASAVEGRGAGLVVAVASFLTFNVLFVEPYGTLAVRDPWDWLILVAFLVTGAVAAQLLHRARTEAEAARDRADALQHLSDVGASALAAPQAEEAAVTIARAITELMAADRVELFLRTEVEDALVRVAMAEGPSCVEAAGPATVQATELLRSVDARALVLPLHVQERPVGLLVVRAASVLRGGGSHEPVLRMLAHYAALGLERIRLTRLAEQADQLREVDRLKDVVLSAVSHDLRTPLTTITALAHEIRESGDERGLLVEEEADRLNRFVTGLLDLSRLNAGALAVHAEAIPLDDLFGALVQAVDRIVRGREFSVELEGDFTRLVAWGDWVMTLRVLVNLVENGVRYSPDGAPIEVRGRRDGGRILVTVADRGPGIRGSDERLIFEPFARGEAPPAVAGTGLGLSIAKRFTEAQGGGLRHAPREGGGTIFILDLAAVPDEQITAGSL